MKIAICDDEAAVSDVTKSLLQQWAPVDFTFCPLL